MLVVAMWSTGIVSSTFIWLMLWCVVVAFLSRIAVRLTTGSWSAGPTRRCGPSWHCTPFGYSSTAAPSTEVGSVRGSARRVFGVTLPSTILHRKFLPYCSLSFRAFMSGCRFLKVRQHCSRLGRTCSFMNTRHAICHRIGPTSLGTTLMVSGILVND